MMLDLSRYKTIVFDCDGVILNSNAAKTEQFYNTTVCYGEDAAQAFVAHHVANGGISRFKKFERFLREVVPPGTPGPGVQELLDDYAARVRHALFTCEIAPKLAELRDKTRHARWLVISGGAEVELKEIFATRGLAPLFDGGVFGSPETKDTIFARELARGNIELPAIYLGDSRYDHQAAVKAGLDFAFISGWSDFEPWREYCAQHQLAHVPALGDLLS